MDDWIADSPDGRDYDEGCSEEGEALKLVFEQIKMKAKM
jgi:hypothetical protein